MVLEVFGDILYYPESKHLQEFPSPEALKGRIILSTKPPKEYLESKGGTMKERGIEPQFRKGESEEAAWGIELPDIQEEMQVAERVLLVLMCAAVYLFVFLVHNFCPSTYF
jgi:phosphatidylinositol phospholipase C, delta